MAATALTALALAAAALSPLSAAAAAAAAARASSFPVPPETTSNQRASLARKQAEAKAASEAATPTLLAFLASSEMELVLGQCCPAVAELDPRGRLEVLRKAVRTSELVHNFPSSTSGYFKDVTPELAVQYGWFLNQWQAQIIASNSSAFVPRSMRDPRLAHTSKHPPHHKFIPVAEEAIFGCPPFAREGNPTWEEAADRLIYVAHNMRQLDHGNSIFFGNISAVFRTGYVHQNVLIAAIDTGIWEGSCNNSMGPDLSLNCSYWRPEYVGTLDYHDHLLIQNLGLWSGYGQSHGGSNITHEATLLFSRSTLAGANYAEIPPIVRADVDKYFETNILGNPRYPDAVKFLIAPIAELFGTATGNEIQNVCDYHSWPLVWAVGPGKLPKEALYPGNQRILDPSTKAVSKLNLSMPVNALETFQTVWKEAEATREAARSEGRNITSAEVESWWETLKADQVRLAPVSGFFCEDIDSCIGIQITNEGMNSHCVCESIKYD